MAQRAPREGGGANFLDSILGNIGKLHSEARRTDTAEEAPKLQARCTSQVLSIQLLANELLGASHATPRAV